jgi:signal transduction histidine kinase
VLFRVCAEEDMVVLEVADEGIGIPEDELPHLFESFHRASNVGTIQGTGLGLAIVRNAVDIHGGTIAVRSSAGSGTTFTVRLPVRH